MLQKYRIISKSKKRSCPKRKQNTNYAKKNANFRKSYTIVIQNNIEYQNYCICVNLRNLRSKKLLRQPHSGAIYELRYFEGEQPNCALKHLLK